MKPPAKKSTAKKPTPQRVFLGWDEPLLPRAASYLRERYAAGGRWDLSRVTLVVPAGRARRRLEALLRLEAEEHDLQLTAGRVLTVGALPEELYGPGTELALELEQTLAWTRVLTSTDAGRLKPLMASLPPLEPLSPWMELAAALRRLHETLAADGLTFADVIPEVDTAAEQQRWRLLDSLLGEYRQQLAAAGRLDPFLARLEAVGKQQCRTAADVVLIGAADLNRSLCRMLDAVAERVTVLVAAPEDEQALFDAYGSVQPQEWNMKDLPLEDRHLVSAGDATEQVEAMASQLADFGTTFSADAITVGVTDESFVTFVETELQQCGIAAHREQGWPLAQTAPGRLLSLLSLLRTRMNWASLAALVRHADVYDWVDAQLQQWEAREPLKIEKKHARSANLPWLTQLDGFLGEHYPTQLDHPLPASAAAAYPLVPRLAELILKWIAPLTAGPQPLADWCDTLGRLVETIYPVDRDLQNVISGCPHPENPPLAKARPSQGEAEGGSGDNDAPRDGGEERAGRAEHSTDLDPRSRLAVERITAMLDRLAGLSETLDVAVPAASAIEMLMGRLADAPIVLPAEPEMVEILGWLDLALDDSLAMVVVGFNHPYVPESVTADAFLPGSLRSRLNISDNDRRYARDAFSLHLILSTRSATRLVVGRRGPDGSPTPPSRLLSAASGTDVARRVMMLLDQPPPVAPVQHLWSGKAARTELPIPTAGKARIDVMSVTAFSAYLACPFRFYLRHVLGLRPMDDQSRELQANQFGDLVHAALEEFGDDEKHRLAEDPKEIQDHLFEHLHAYAEQRFGADPAAAVRMQIHQAERRLMLVAEEQARRRAEGWEIRFAEASVDPKNGAGIDVDGRRMGLKGRFDRIDFHPGTGQWAILDYKTHGHKPLKKHIDSATGNWIDLQLPLYRLMAPYLDIDAPIEDIELGYFNVAEQAGNTGVNLAEFTPEQFDEANEVIYDCIRRIWRNDFARSSEPVTYDDYAMICQTGLAQTLLDEFASEAESEESF
ncbi:PD-(D/E)XK nuclease family protein [Roseimaritima ulvae]|uniref:ATP-dependent helicase/deoxyribonuclease subunit B n=1 Tax=Roseimaritima ulvae TaxID=980254 RepID=A0A5B9QU13_9BACT|nr:PD-(D/E)XK nuclease family protein [Roseimaritima ulvae]QEG41449.1 ATP-dependent helicase/deoxyribonuclease subunit B [Roseimaritima ulvae]